MKQRDWGLLLLLIAASGRRTSSGTRGDRWSPMGPFPEGNTIPQQPTMPPNPLEPKKP